MKEPPLPGRRIVIRGTSGSGKSTLAKALAETLDVRHIELDALFHMPGWTPRPIDDFRRLVDEATGSEGWTMDGNYSKVEDISFSKADTLIFLDYPVPLVLTRLTRRTFRRWWKNELLWGTNRESLWRHFFVPKDSLYWWVLTTYKKRRADAVDNMKPGKHPGKVVLHFNNPRDTDIWLDRVREASRQGL